MAAEGADDRVVGKENRRQGLRVIDVDLYSADALLGGNLFRVLDHCGDLEFTAYSFSQQSRSDIAAGANQC